MPFTETYTALETGAIDGMTNPLINVKDSKFYEVTDYLTITNHMYNPQAVTISKITWDKLSDTEEDLPRGRARGHRLPARGGEEGVRRGA